MKHKWLSKIIEALFFIAASFSVLSVLAITVFLFTNGIPAIGEVGLFDFLFGKEWDPGGNAFGIWPMLVGSLLIAGGAIFVGVIGGIMTAVFLSEIAPPFVIRIFKPAINLLAGIPSVIYGFFGLIVIVPLIRNTLGGRGQSLLAGIIILSIMILPTIISITQTSLKALPPEHNENSLALGASKIQTIFKVLIPAAKSGIMSGVVLGIGRAIGETMAVILVTGNTALIPDSVLSPIRTLTATIAMEMSYSNGLHRQVLFAIGVILFIFILVLNLILQFALNRKKVRT